MTRLRIEVFFKCLEEYYLFSPSSNELPESFLTQHCKCHASRLFCTLPVIFRDGITIHDTVMNVMGPTYNFGQISTKGAIDTEMKCSLGAGWAVNSPKLPRYTVASKRGSFKCVNPALTAQTCHMNRARRKCWSDWCVLYIVVCFNLHSLS